LNEGIPITATLFDTLSGGAFRGNPVVWFIPFVVFGAFTELGIETAPRTAIHTITTSIIPTSAIYTASENPSIHKGGDNSTRAISDVFIPSVAIFKVSKGVGTYSGITVKYVGKAEGATTRGGSTTPRCCFQRSGECHSF
jgi:hypothetical protein